MRTGSRSSASSLPPHHHHHHHDALFVTSSPQHMSQAFFFLTCRETACMLSQRYESQPYIERRRDRWRGEEINRRRTELERQREWGGGGLQRNPNSKEGRQRYANISGELSALVLGGRCVYLCVSRVNSGGQECVAEL